MCVNHINAYPVNGIFLYVLPGFFLPIHSNSGLKSGAGMENLRLTYWSIHVLIAYDLSLVTCFLNLPLVSYF